MDIAAIASVLIIDDDRTLQRQLADAAHRNFKRGVRFPHIPWLLLVLLALLLADFALTARPA